jgi:hypothetical protein
MAWIKERESLWNRISTISQYITQVNKEITVVKNNIVELIGVDVSNLATIDNITDLESELKNYVNKSVEEIELTHGEKGEKGDKGDPGVNGIDGVNGVDDDKGEKGDTELKGDKGDKGDKAEKGDIGESGNEVNLSEYLPNDRVYQFGNLDGGGINIGYNSSIVASSNVVWFMPPRKINRQNWPKSL